MSAHPVSFRRSVGTSDAPDYADMSDEMMERPRQQSSTASSNHSSSTIRHFDSLRLKDEILGLAAHELRGPLTPLRLATHMVRTAFADRLDLLRAIEVIDRQIVEIARLTEDLMDATRVGQNVLHLSKVEVDVVDVLADPCEVAMLYAAHL
jgi:signal transduction histidine kinase